MDPSMTANLSDAERAKMLEYINDMGVRDQQQMFNELGERCFEVCVTSFRQKSLDSSERDCLRDCVTKFLNTTQRVLQRFQEQQAAQQDPAGQVA
ncbi:MAG: hypothetical protein MHM6MM_005316 [Cercozoa sp. M6MM]